MLRTLTRAVVRTATTSDRVAGGLARFATTLGQCALVVLGVHLAADDLDDRVLASLSWVVDQADLRLAGPVETVAGWFGRPAGSWQWWDALPLGAMSGWTALTVELVAAGLLCGSFLLTSRTAQPTWVRWKRALSVQAVVLPLALSGVLLAGGWSLSMAIEDVLPVAEAAPWASRAAAAVVAFAALLRFGLPAWLRAVAALEPPARWTAGWAAAVVLLPVGALAWIHGVPVWGTLRHALEAL
ncbi:MAG: hypothetical protein H6742_00995 [Alphaproteobacteria bacterium]|nr:hypothetical protein [Alphaproteobacteria bacterium]